MLKSCHS